MKGRLALRMLGVLALLVVQFHAVALPTTQAAPIPPSCPIAPAPIANGTDWTTWRSLGGVLTDSPAATAFNCRIYVFAKGADRALYVASSSDGANWTAWRSLGGILTAAPSATSNNGMLYVFAKGSDNALYEKHSADGNSFTDWRSLGGILTAPPAATNANGLLYVFAKGSDSALYIKRSGDGVNWTAWQNLGGILTAAPAAANFQDQVYVFAKGSDNALYVKSSTDGVTFTNWRNYGGILTAAPSAASFTPFSGSEFLYTFAKGADNALYERHTADGLNWTDWVSLGGQLIGPPAAAGMNGTLFAFVWWRGNPLMERHLTPDIASWLTVLNAYRALAGLPPVREDPVASADCRLHARYIVEINAVGHFEDPASSWYTADGDRAARESDLIGSGVTLSARRAVEAWLNAPFHAFPLVSPRLTTSGYGEYGRQQPVAGRLNWGACLNVLRGPTMTPSASQYPIEWPVDGGMQPFLQGTAGEYPDPIRPCGYQYPVGGFVLFQLDQAIQLGTRGTLTTADGSVLESCVYDANTYVSSNSEEQNLARTVLEGYNAVVVVPRQPLAPGSTYRVTLVVNGQPYSWTFRTIGGAQAAGQGMPPAVWIR